MKPDASTAGFVAGNLIAIAVAVFYGYDFSAMAWAYLLESIVIGAFVLAGILLGGFRSPIETQLVPYIKLAAIFAACYGLFFFIVWSALVNNPKFYLGQDVLPAVAALGLGHAFSFYRSNFGTAAPRKMETEALAAQVAGTLMRILPIFVAIIIGMAVYGTGTMADRTLVLVLMVLKTLADVGVRLIGSDA